MTHKEFFYWLDGFITSKEVLSLNQNDIETIKSKMKEVRDEVGISQNILTEITIPKAPTFKNIENE